MLDDDYTYTPSGDGESRFYSGPVFDLQVETAESFVTSSGIAHNCRHWGAVESLPCPHGCRPGRMLSHEAGQQVLTEARKIGGEVVFTVRP